MTRQTSRRSVLKSTVALTGALLATPRISSAGSHAQQPLLPTVSLGRHQVTRLLLGSNPFNGFSYGIPSLASHMKEWATPERIAGVIDQAWRNGINTWQFSYYPDSLAGLKLHQEAGGRIQWILLTGGTMKNNLPLMREAARMGPLAIVHHGGVTDERFRAGQMETVHDYLKAIRGTGVMVGLSTHLPQVIDYVDGKGWDVDFYMACFHQIGRPLEELRKMLGEAPLGPVFLEGDPGRMCRAIRQTPKPCLAFKILAAGRMGENPEQLESAFQFAFDNIKPQDGVIVGMYPRFKDEVAENAAIVRKLCTLPT